MKKFIITAAIDALIHANAEFVPASDRGPNALNVMLSYPDGYRVGFEGRREAESGQFVFTASHEQVVDDVTGDFNALGIAYELKSFEGSGLKINVLELLRSGWLIRAPAGRNVLRVTLPSGIEVELNYRNDGTSMYAEFDGIDEDQASDLRRTVLAMLRTQLENVRVQYEVL